MPLCLFKEKENKVNESTYSYLKTDIGSLQCFELGHNLYILVNFSKVRHLQSALIFSILKLPHSLHFCLSLPLCS